MHTGLEQKRGDLKKLATFYQLRAQGGVGLIIKGSIPPNFVGGISPMAAQLSFPWKTAKHRLITQAAHKTPNAKICPQILHAERYVYHPLCVSAFIEKSDILPFTPVHSSI